MNDNNFAGNSREAVDFLGKKWKYDCMGCAISIGKIEIPGGFIYEGRHTILGADPEIPIPGFLIVNCKRHVNSFSELTKEERNEISDVIVIAEKALKDLGITEKVTLVQEERSKHLHIWIFPTHDWMIEKFGKGIKYFRDISEYAQKNVTEDNVKEVLDAIDRVRNYIKEHYIEE